jgi:hypothetical protein
MTYRTILPVLVLTTLCVSCTPVERTAYNTAVASKAFLDNIKSKHPECQTYMTTLCSDLRKATAAKDLLIDAGEAYCNQATFPATDVTSCKPAPKGTPLYQQALSALNSAVSGYKQAEADLRAVVK